MNLYDLGALELAARLRRRELSPVELCDAHIRRIEEVNPALNALVADRFPQARDEARAVERRLLDGEPDLPPLLGVPCTIKEYLSVAGMPVSAGIHSRRHVRAHADAEVVRRIRAAGAIVLGVTNVPEGGIWLETYNKVYGLTRNPWDLRRTAGGSTGGEAALIAAGGSPFGLGADVGGSIRLPAAFCGIVGHKPSGRMVPNAGYWPSVPGELDAYLTTGPMARKVDDLWAILKLIAGPDPRSPIVRTWPEGALAGELSDVDLRGMTVYPMERAGRVRPSGPLRDAIRRAASALEARGARVAELRTRGLDRAFEIWGAMLAAVPGASYAEVLGNGTPIRVWRELLLLPFGRSAHTAPALIVSAAEELLKRIPGRVEQWVAAGRALQTELEAELGERGVLLYPPYSRTAPRHHGPWLTLLDFVCTAIFNVLEFPSTVVPMGFDREGMPLSVQVVGGRGRDKRTLAVARALEQDFGGWVRATPSRY